MESIKYSVLLVPGNELGQNCKRGKFLKKFWCYAVFFLGEEGVLYNKLVIM